LGNWFLVAFRVVILIALVIFTVLSKVVQYYGYQIHDWDTGIYSNVVWNLMSGDWFHSDVLNRNLLGEHFSPIIAVFIPFFAIHPSPIWLVAAQGLAIGLTYVLLYFVALKIFSEANVSLATLLALIFAIWASLYGPLTSALLFEFHPSTLATPLLAAAVLALLHGYDRVLWVLVAGLFLSKENAPLAVLGLGCYAGLVLVRPRLGMALSIVAAVSGVLIMGGVMPLFRSGDWGHYGRLGPLEDWRQKLDYVRTLVQALAFLPLASWRSLICAVPLIGLNLSVAYYPQFSTKLHYDDFASVFLLVAAMHGAVVVLRIVGSAFKGWQVTATYAVIAAIAVLLAGLEARSAVAYLFRAWPGDKERQLDQELAYYRSLPIDTGIAAESVLGPYLSERRRYVSIYSASRGLDMERLKPGDKVLITTIESGFTELERLLEETPGLTRVHVSSVLSVYEVQETRRN
jgi:uncharacterized membrane protein